MDARKIPKSGKSADLLPYFPILALPVPMLRQVLASGLQLYITLETKFIVTPREVLNIREAHLQWDAAE